MKRTILILCLISVSWAVTDPWGDNLRPKLYIDYLTQYSGSAEKFLGNQTHKDYFKLLRTDGTSLLIGARNVVYNLTLPYLNENPDQRITWDPSDTDRELCLLKGKSEDDCQNYIRVLAHTEDGRLLVCGTNAFNPRCRLYSHNATHSHVDREFSGKGFCPYDPRHNSTALYTNGELYSGTVADFSATDSLIIKDQLRTEQYDYKHLNSPDFVSSIEDDDHVYFFFRESAVEFINCGKSIYSRVARVCKNDKGGPHKFNNKWTSFLKSRLNCSVPGDIPFYFDEIQSTTGFVERTREPVNRGSLKNDQIFYGVFTTPDNAIAGSAVCSFRLSDVISVFEDGPFKNQETVNSNWLPTSKSQIPEPRPGLCYNDTFTLPEPSLNFIKRHSLMDWSVPSAESGPIFIKTGLGERLTVIAVDADVTSVDGRSHDVIFVGTTHGRVIKFINSVGPKQNLAEPVLIESLQIFPIRVPVRNLLVVHPKDEPAKLIVLSDHEVNSIPLHRCQAPAAQSCFDCVALQDPYCAWNVHTGLCQAHTENTDVKKDAFLQDLNRGLNADCPVVTTTPKKEDITEAPVDSITTTVLTTSTLSTNVTSSTASTTSTTAPFYDDDVSNAIEEERRHRNDHRRRPHDHFSPSYEASLDHSNESVYSEQTLAVAIVLTALFALAIGFLVGFVTSQRCPTHPAAFCSQTSSSASTTSSTSPHKEFFTMEIVDKTLSLKNRASAALTRAGVRCSNQFGRIYDHRRFGLGSSSGSSNGGSDQEASNRTVSSTAGSPPPSPTSSAAAATTAAGNTAMNDLRHLDVHHLDSGYTTPSNRTTETMMSSPGSSTLSPSPTSTASLPSSTATHPADHVLLPDVARHSGNRNDFLLANAKSVNLLANVPPKSETVKRPSRPLITSTTSFPLHQPIYATLSGSGRHLPHIPHHQQQQQHQQVHPYLRHTNSALPSSTTMPRTRPVSHSETTTSPSVRPSLVTASTATPEGTLQKVKRVYL